MYIRGTNISTYWIMNHMNFHDILCIEMLVNEIAQTCLKTFVIRGYTRFDSFTKVRDKNAALLLDCVC